MLAFKQHDIMLTFKRHNHLREAGSLLDRMPSTKQSIY
jgi:hypothetical protein